jgi:hypothetical protein
MYAFRTRVGASRTSALVTAVAAVAVVVGVCGTAAPSRAADNQPLGSASDECNKVWPVAANLPEPTPAAIYDYGTQVVDQSMRCLQAATNELTGANDPAPAPSGSPDSASSSSDDSSSSDQ